MISDRTVIRRAPNVAEVVGVSETALLKLGGRDPRPLVLNGPGSMIWAETSVEGSRVASITLKVAEAVGAEPDLISTDVAGFLNALAEQGLIEVHEGASEL